MEMQRTVFTTDSAVKFDSKSKLNSTRQTSPDILTVVRSLSHIMHICAYGTLYLPPPPLEDTKFTITCQSAKVKELWRNKIKQYGFVILSIWNFYTWQKFYIARRYSYFQAQHWVSKNNKLINLDRCESTYESRAHSLLGDIIAFKKTCSTNIVTNIHKRKRRTDPQAKALNIQIQNQKRHSQVSTRAVESDFKKSNKSRIPKSFLSDFFHVDSPCSCDHFEMRLTYVGPLVPKLYAFLKKYFLEKHSVWRRTTLNFRGRFRQILILNQSAGILGAQIIY